MDAGRFLRDHGFHVATPGERHWSEGWTNTPCPFCTGRSAGNHLGHDGKEPWVCWRCGPHSSVEVVKQFLGGSWGEARRTVGEYGGRGDIARKPPSRAPGTLSGEAPLPVGSGPPGERHLEYLRIRGFQDPEGLCRTWGILGTGPASDLPWRLVAPVFVDGRRVSWISRDVTGRASTRYLPCPRGREILPHKHTLYGIDQILRGGFLILVEGIVDVWKLGPGAVALFGQRPTPAQQLLIIRSGVSRVGVFLDPDAITSASIIVSILCGVGMDCYLIQSDRDPGDLQEGEAREMVFRFSENRLYS